jgi:cytochrome c oxidase assembly protein subunit 11
MTGWTRGKVLTVAASGVAIAVMLGLVSYSPTLYRLFCSVTGYGGTVQRAKAVTFGVSKHTVVVRFDTNVAPGLDWDFKPLQSQVVAKLGEPTEVYFYSKNLSDKPIVARAVYNVTPFKVGPYFTKTQCFCFTDELLKPGESARMPVVFYVDPKLATDPSTSDVDTITLAYTFFKSDDQSETGAQDLGSRVTAETGQDKTLVTGSDQARAKALANGQTSYATPPMISETAASHSVQQ